MQLNKGELLHALKKRLFIAHEGHLHRRDLEDNVNQANCLNLVTNAVITWNTMYLELVLDQLRDENRPVGPEALSHISPTMYGHINPYGQYRFDEVGLKPGEFRALRQPGSATP